MLQEEDLFRNLWLDNKGSDFKGDKMDARPYQISIEDVRKTMSYLKENHRIYYILYRAMLESGLGSSTCLR